MAPELFPDIREEEWEHYYGAGTRDYTDGTRDILIEQGILDSSGWTDKNEGSPSNLYEVLYIPYYEKLIAIQ